MTKIYTKTGDEGETSLWGGKRIDKDDPQVEAYGSADELTTIIGAALQHDLSRADKDFLTYVQKDLYAIMSLLSNAQVSLRDVEERIEIMEKRIDEIEKEKPVPGKFILVQGSAASVSLHMARVICRKVERRITAFFNTEPEEPTSKQQKIVLQYVNRLSDVLFSLARLYNDKKELLV